MRSKTAKKAGNNGVRRFMAVSMAILMAASAWAYNKSMYPYTLNGQGAALGCVRAVEGMKLELGKWYTNFQVCKKYADDNGLPLLAVWSNAGCVHCWYTDIVFVQPEFIEWQKTHDAGKVICCFMAGGHDNIDQAGSPSYNWMWYGGGSRINAYPFVVMWWQKGGVNRRMDGDTFCKGSSKSALSFTDATIPTRVANVEAMMSDVFKNWKAAAPYSGGTFALEETAGNRLEVERNGQKVSVDIVRAADVSGIATNNLLSIVTPGGTTVETVSVSWAANQTRQTFDVYLTNVTFTANGQQASLVLKDTDGTAKGTLKVTYVQSENSVANPLWIGERDENSLDYGEWTMDIDVAKKKVAAASGAAYTLVAVEGALWCPDCANTERNFTSLKDANGSNRLAAWAKSKQVALVAIDIPNFTSATGPFETPTLLSRTAYPSTLARAKEYPASGADSVNTNRMMRSGLGYLTRKGVSDKQADEVLARNRWFVKTDFSKNGFHSPEDTNSSRTGVPIFVLLRKDGTVAARLTRFASVSPMKADQANFDNYIKRFEEMLEIAAETGDHADTSEPGNNYPGSGAMAFQANGGSASGEISHTDFRDVFKLVGVGGNALQNVKVRGGKSANVTVSFLKLDADGNKETVGTPVSGNLSSGVELEHTFTSAGDYYVEVSGGDIATGSFTIGNATANNFASYAISGTVVLVPQEDMATASAPAGSDKVTMRFVKDKIYKISGIKAADVASFLRANGNDLYTAIEGGDKTLTLSAVGASMSYQIWKTGSVGFKVATGSAKETDNSFVVTLSRTGGKSGAEVVSVAVDTSATTFVDIDGNPRYVFAAQEVSWADGDAADKTVKITINNDDVYDGDGIVTLKAQKISGSADLEQATFTLSVTEDDTAAPGRILFAGAAGGFAKKQTVYAKATAGATIYVDRIEASDGRVTATIKSALAGVTFGGDATAAGVVTWANRDGAVKNVTVKGIPAGRSAMLTFGALTGGATTLPASNTVTVTSVRDDGPEFRDAGPAKVSLYRYILSSNSYPLAAAPSGRVTFTKLYGTLPAGLRVAYDAASKAMVVYGTPTAKSGSYSVSYQAKDGTIAGLVKQIDFTVYDPTDAKASPGTANVSVATARTFRDIPVVNSVNRRLLGTLQVTIPTKGNVSAKYTCESGAISMSSKGWDEFEPDTKNLHARATGRNGFALDVICENDGSVSVSLDTEAKSESLWSRTKPATAWKGYYTAALPVVSMEVDREDTPNLASRGIGYVTLKMDTASAWNSGKVTWAGMLPNGTAVSGATVLSAVDATWAELPLFKVSARDTLSVLAKIRANAVANAVTRAVFPADGVDGCWDHNERDSAFKADYTANLNIYGGPYSTTSDLAACCQENYETTSPTLKFDTAALDWTSYGLPGSVANTTVIVGEKTLVLQQGAPAGMTLRLTRNTGIVTGTVKIPYGDAGRTISATWKGVVVQGWGPGCGCDPGVEGTVYLPFVNGSYYFNDKVSREVNGRTQTLTVKRGGKVSLY